MFDTPPRPRGACSRHDCLHNQNSAADIASAPSSFFSVAGANSAFCPNTTNIMPLLPLQYDGLPVQTVRRAWALQLLNWGRHRRRPLTRIESCRVWLVGRRRQEGRQPTELGHPHLSSCALSLLSFCNGRSLRPRLLDAAALLAVTRGSRHIAQIGP